MGVKGISTIFYLDDILIIGPSFNICLKNTLDALHLLISAGFIFHEEKSCLVPSTDFPFLGFQWNTVQASLSIPQMKVDVLHVQAKILQLESPHLSTSDGADRPHRGLLQSSPSSSPERKMAANDPIVVYSSEADLQKTVTLCPQAKRDLQWIISLSPHQCFAPLWCLSPEACNLEVQTEASNEGFGVWFQGFLHQGKWVSTIAGLHINVLETIALWRFLAFSLPKSSKPRNILWRIDNTTALAYIKKEGGMCSTLVLAVKALVLAHQMSVRILPVYIPTEENILADAASRFQEIPD
jgi:hypothetical protein